MTLLDEIEKMSNPELEALKERSLKQQQAQTVGQAAASVAPGLIGMLVGGTNDFRARQFDKGNQIAEGVGKQFLDNQKNLKEVMLDGQPRYVTGQEALYEEPYKAPPKASGVTGSEKGRYQMQPIYNHNTKKYETVIFDTATKEIINQSDMIIRPSSPKISQNKTYTGGTDVKQYNPYDSSQNKVVHTEPGIGEIGTSTTRGQVSKQEAEQFLKDSAKSKDKKVKIVESSEAAKKAITILSNESASPEEVVNAVRNLMKSSEQGKLSDADAVALAGNDYKSYKRLLEDFYSGRGLGEISPKSRQGFINVARSILKSNKSSMDELDKLYTPSGRLPKKQQDALNKTSTGNIEDKAKSFKERQKALMEIK